MIVSLYKIGDSIVDICRKLDIVGIYQVNNDIAEYALFKAINGHNGSFRIKAYDGLIEEERQKIGLEHKASGSIIGGIISGYKSYRESKGIFRRDMEKISKDSFKGGMKLYKEKKGIFARSLEQIKEYAKESVIKRGQIPWSYEEKNTLIIFL